MRILFLGFRHRVNDARLFHRQMKLIMRDQVAHSNKTGIYFLTHTQLHDLTPYLIGEQDIGDLARRTAPPPPSPKPISPRERLQAYLRRIKRALSMWRQMLTILRLKPTVIQASDARELGWAVMLHVLTGAKIIYDSHEDYFNQIYEYRDRTWNNTIKAYMLAWMEIVFMRFFATVFCTDDFLFEKYAQPIYGCRELHLLRNFPLTHAMPTCTSYVEKETLELVYIGTVNQYRGVTECAEYVARFNQTHAPRQLRFTAYTLRHPIIQELLQQGRIQLVPLIDYTDLMQRLTQYDVGICLLHPLEKFQRNLPLKNFDYMGVGLPILTSNFGNLAHYAQLSGAALCIDPFSYTEFEAAILTLFDPAQRQQLGESGVAYTRASASFEVEAVTYIKSITTK